ncbi:hypothetical protein MASR1M66_11520 [Aminivibrio sp.]
MCGRLSFDTATPGEMSQRDLAEMESLTQGNKGVWKTVSSNRKSVRPSTAR